MSLDYVDIKNSALLIIDIQNDYLHEKGAMGKHHVVVKEGDNDIFTVQKIVPKVKYIAVQARKLGIPVIFIKSEYSKWTDSPVFKTRHRLLGVDYTEQVRPGTWGAEFYQISPEPEDCVVIKYRHSAFIGTNLDLVLRSIGIKTIVLTGVTTNTCVQSTARDGFMNDYYVVMVEDCVAAWSKREHEAGLSDINTAFGVVANSQEVIDAWQAVRK
jgi:ureidoacrylate peracid hydrolase